MPDYDHWGVKVGPVIVGGSSEKRPKTRSDRRSALFCWAITVFLIALASPITGVVLIILTAIYLAGRSTPADTSTTDERKQP